MAAAGVNAVPTATVGGLRGGEGKSTVGVLQGMGRVRPEDVPTAPKGMPKYNPAALCEALEPCLTEWEHE